MLSYSCLFTGRAFALPMHDLHVSVVSFDIVLIKNYLSLEVRMAILHVCIALLRIMLPSSMR